MAAPPHRNIHSIYCYQYPIFLLYKYALVLDLRNKHHYLPIILNILNDQDIDFQKRTTVQLSNILNDIICILGLNCLDFNNDESSNIQINTKNEPLMQHSHLSITTDLINRKLSSGNLFCINPDVKRSFGIKYCKYSLMNIKYDVLVMIDDSTFEILEADVVRRAADGAALPV